MSEVEFDISSLDSVDQATMVVLSNGQPTSWVWTFGGPSHPKTIALADRIARERLAIEAAKEQAQVNGRKWKSDQQSPEAVLQKNVRLVTDRLLDWSPVKMNGEPYPYSEENARKLLLDPRKGALLRQALDFLGDEAAFTKRS